MKDILDYEKFKGEFVSELYTHIPDGAKLIVNTDGVNESVVYVDENDILSERIFLYNKEKKTLTDCLKFNI